jgi:hypothetical protein
MKRFMDFPIRRRGIGFRADAAELTVSRGAAHPDFRVRRLAERARPFYMKASSGALTPASRG